MPCADAATPRTSGRGELTLANRRFLLREQFLGILERAAAVGARLHQHVLQAGR